MRFHTYSKFSPEMADAVDLQSLLDKLADFLLQSGFAGEQGQLVLRHGLRRAEATARSTRCKQAILDALMESGQFTPEMLEALRGDGDEESQAKLAKLLDDLVQRLIDEGYLNLDAPPQMPAGHQPVTGTGWLAQAAARDVQFNLTEKGDRLPRLQDAAQPPRLARQVELRQPRHAVSRDGHRGGRLEQAVRVRRRAEHRRQRDAEELAWRAPATIERADGPRLRRPDGAPGGVPLDRARRC